MKRQRGTAVRPSAAEFESFVDTLQERVFAEAKKAYGEAGFTRWRCPGNRGGLVNPDGYGRVTGDCGDTMELFLRVRDNVVNEASYTTTGCGSSSICGSFAAELAVGRQVEDLFNVTGEQILAAIGTFPREEQHCAFLAATTLQAAANHFLVVQAQKSRHGETGSTGT